MKRIVITTETVQDARRGAVKELLLPASGIVTPAAADMAVSLGIAITRGNACSRAAETDMPPPACPSDTEAAGVRTKTDKRREPHPNGREPGNAAPGMAVAQADALFAEVKKRVLERLPEAMRSDPMIDELVCKSLAAIEHRQTGENAGQARPVHYTSAPLSSARGTDTASSEAAWREKADRGMRIDSSRLPWKKPLSAKDGANIMDILSRKDGLPCSVGYMEWEASSFAWKAEHDEINTVLQGELELAIEGKTLCGKPGDVLFIPGGTEVLYSSAGYVRFVYVSCAHRRA